MASYKIFIKKSAVKELEGIPKEYLRKITERIHMLAQNPRPPVSRKLSHQELYRVRQGDYRIIYLVRDEEKIVEVVKIGHRREIYR